MVGGITKKTIKDTAKHGYDELSDKHDSKTQIRQTLLGTLLYFIGVLFYSASFASVQYLGGAVPDNELNALRFITTAVSVCPLLIMQKRTLKVPTSVWLPLVISSMMSVFYNFAMYASPLFIPLGEVGGLSTCGAMVWNAFSSICVNS